MSSLKVFIRFTLTKEGRKLWLVLGFNLLVILSVYLLAKIVYVRFILGIVYVLYLPGYSLVELIFPNKKDVNGVERTVYSIGLSIVVVILLSYVLNYTLWGITLSPLLVGLFSFTVFCIFLASIRKYQKTNFA